MTPSSNLAIQTPKTFLGRGEMVDRIYSHSWDKTSLGPMNTWSPSLLTSLSLILNSKHPMWIGWGPDLIFFYNDAYIEVLGKAKHISALGRPTAEVWAEIWDVCGPLAEQVLQYGDSPYVNDVRLFMKREDFMEETFYCFFLQPDL